MTDAAEKYRDRVDPEHAMAMQSIGFAATVVRTHRDKLARLIDSAQYMHNVGGLIDPTLYRDMLNSKNVDRQLRLARAAIAFLNEVDAIAAEIADAPPRTGESA